MKISELTDEVLYHGTTEEALEDILTNGISAPSYWGDELKAGEYGKIIFAVPLYRFNEKALTENENFVYAYQDDPEVIDIWNASNQTWRDSLKIFDSVVYQETMLVNEEDLL